VRINHKQQDDEGREQPDADELPGDGYPGPREEETAQRKHELLAKHVLEGLVWV
jgi:hypothetical protein